MDNFTEILRMDAHDSYVLSVDTLPESDIIVSGGEDGTIKIWGRNGELLHTAVHQGDVER